MDVSEYKRHLHTCARSTLLAFQHMTCVISVIDAGNQPSVYGLLHSTDPTLRLCPLNEVLHKLPGGDWAIEKLVSILNAFKTLSLYEILVIISSKRTVEHFFLE
jgi:hypothetical protein